MPGLRIVRVVDFATMRSAGPPAALRRLGMGYRRAGHEPILVVPGRRYRDEMTSTGRVISLPGTALPRTGGRRVLADRRRLSKLLEELRPDRIEVSDRFTLRWTGRWARRRGIGSVMVAHESLAGMLGAWGIPAPDALADRLNRRTAEAFDQIICTSATAAAEFRRIAVDNLLEIPLGVDTEMFHPGRADPAVRAGYARPDEVLVVYCGRLAADKRPEAAVDTVAALRAAGTPAVLVMAGDGPRRAALAYRSARLPVRFAGHIAERPTLAALLASADVVLSPGSSETSGRAVLEALASGTPVVVEDSGALVGLVGDAGVAVPGHPGDLADGVRRLLARSERGRRAAARARAEAFAWPQAVDGFLRAHGAQTSALPGTGVAGRRAAVANPLRPAIPAARTTQAAMPAWAWAGAPANRPLR